MSAKNTEGTSQEKRGPILRPRWLASMITGFCALQAYLDPYKAATLSAAVSNPDDGNAVPIDYTWTVTVNGVDKVIGDTLTLHWVPSSDVTFDCGGQYITLTLKATDDDGSGQDSIDALVPYPPC